MSFSIVLYINKSDNNYLDKDLTEISTISGTLRDDTSIINPSIVIVGPITNIFKCNYIYISSFNRYYYVNDIKSVRNNVYELSCHVDVLMSYKNGIRNNTAIISKQENDWNLYLNDGSFHVYNNPMVLTKEFPNGFSSWSFVMGIAGG